MLKQNHINSVNILLAEYCGVDKTLPIWGEVQHSLWMHKKFIADKRPFFCNRIFTWNRIFENSNTFPIGDPFLYSMKVDQQLEKEANQRFLVFPSAKLHADGKTVTPENFKSELSHIEQVIQRAESMHPGIEFSVNLHPTIRHNQLLIKSLMENGHQVVEYPDPGKYFQLLKGTILVVSDYPGAHIFRAQVAGGDSFILPHEDNLDLGKVYSDTPELQNLINDFVYNSTNVQTKIMISRELLGFTLIKRRSDLAKILGLTGYKKMIGPNIRRAYNIKLRIVG